MPKKVTGTKEWSTRSYNVQIGCEGNDCKYCYARYNAIRRFKTVVSEGEWLKPRIDWSKVNKKWHKVPGRIMFPSQHDITPCNIEPCLTALTNMLDAGNEVLIVSKPNLSCVSAMCDHLAKWKDQILFRFTITAMDDGILKYWEPGAPCFGERFASLKHARSLGFRTSVSCEPCLDLPNFDSLFELLEPWVTDGIWLGMMNKIDQRVEVLNDEDRRMVAFIKSFQTKAVYEGIYKHLRDNLTIRWKGEIREILGLPLMKNAGEDR